MAIRTTRKDGGELLPARRSEAAVNEPQMRDWAEALVERARAEGVQLTGENGLLTGLVRQVLQTGLEVEMAELAPRLRGL